VKTHKHCRLQWPFARTQFELNAFRRKVRSISSSEKRKSLWTKCETFHAMNNIRIILNFSILLQCVDLSLRSNFCRSCATSVSIHDKCVLTDVAHKRQVERKVKYKSSSFSHADHLSAMFSDRVKMKLQFCLLILHCDYTFCCGV
jgi:hypothetical protein